MATKGTSQITFGNKPLTLIRGAAQKEEVFGHPVLTAAELSMRVHQSACSRSTGRLQ